jgi:GH15 family glucan-1,4-alpha-glucosidase
MALSCYKPIESYGVIGDLHSVALVATDGSIDWCCLPHFDSPSVFAAILDKDKGGYFRISAIYPAEDNHDDHCRAAWLEAGRLNREKQMYLPDTNVLITRFLSADGVGEVVDFMPVPRESGGPTRQRSHQLIRIVRVVRGSVRFRLECLPAFNFAREPHQVTVDTRGAVFEAPRQAFALVSPVPVVREGDGVAAEFTLRAGESKSFALRHRDGDADKNMYDEPLDGELLLSETADFWRRWMSHCRYDGRWREAVHRSALVLKLLTFQPTGAIVAAPTCSLPEEIGGVRNWDYRYTWVRDAAFTVYALMRLGYTEEAAQFMGFLQARAKEPEAVNGPLNIMYGIDGRHELPEENLTHLEGYCGSRPVRVGNAAAMHLQLDIYGELLDSVYLHDKYGQPISYDMWKVAAGLLEWVASNWNQPDQSIWEVRGGRRPFTYSKLQCWVALDRGLRLAGKRSLPVDRTRIRCERDRIYDAIMTECWNEELQSFVQFYGADAVDASTLMMPLMLFISPTDPRMLSSLERIKNELASDSLVYRYDIDKAARDGLPGGEGTFSICTFWLVEALSRAGRLEDARFVFEKMLTYANHLGLYSEQIGPTGELLGNFPQAFTHLGLISAAFNLNRHLSAGGREA